MLLAVLFNGESLLKLLGIYDKLNFVYQQRGISGILLSSRDYYAGRIWQTTAEHYTDWQRMLGVGQGGVALYLKKYFAELDWFDLLVFHGLAGVLAFVLCFAVFFRSSWKHRASGAGRSLLLLNLLLLPIRLFRTLKFLLPRLPKPLLILYPKISTGSVNLYRTLKSSRMRANSSS